MARNLLFRSMADALFVAVKVHFFVELGGATCANTTRDHFLGSSKVKKDGILASVPGVGFRFVFVWWSRHGAGGDGHIPAVFWEVTLSRPILAHCWRQNFSQRRLSESYLWNFFAIDSFTVTNAPAMWLCTSIDLLRRKPKQGLSGYRELGR